MVKRKRMLYKSRVEYMAGEGVYTMNHVVGCSHGCTYPCYAFLNAKRFGIVKSYEEWCTPRYVENTLELLEDELKRNRKEPIKRVHMCFTTDPLPYIEGLWRELKKSQYGDTLPLAKVEQLAELRRIQKATLDAVMLINSFGIPVTVLTKGTMPFYYDEVSLFGTGVFQGHPDNEFGISLVTCNDDFREKYEPHASTVWERVASLKVAKAAGVKTWVSMEPFPALAPVNPQERVERGEFALLEDALRSVEGVKRVVFGRWNYNENMPCNVADPDAWYKEAAARVRTWCADNGAECIIKKGTE